VKSHAEKSAAELEAALRALTDEPSAPGVSPVMPVHAMRGAPTAHHADPTLRKQTTTPRAPSDANAAPSSAQKILDAIDFTPAMVLSWTQIAMLSGYSESGGQFRRAKKWLIETGAVIDAPNGAKMAKPSGKRRAPTGGELVAFWASKLPGVGAAILQAMWNAKRTPLAATRSLAAIAADLNYQVTGGQFRRGVKCLRDARIAEGSGDSIAFTSAFLEIAMVNG
jgi:hypothetical protein